MGGDIPGYYFPMGVPNYPNYVIFFLLFLSFFFSFFYSKTQNQFLNIQPANRPPMDPAYLNQQVIFSFLKKNDFIYLS